uniref:Uncharacterized protein n=1 Tax=Panstrongylus lignarius TaxID=156445 RepID=A0A224XUX3_9HEMI
MTASLILLTSSTRYTSASSLHNSTFSLWALFPKRVCARAINFSFSAIAFSKFSMLVFISSIWRTHSK